MRMKAVDFAVSRILPPELRQETYNLGKDGLGAIVAQVASKYPEEYPRVVKQLGDLGRRASWLQGYTTGPTDTRPVLDTSVYYAKMDAELADLKKQNLDRDDYEAQRADIMVRYSDLLERDTMAAAMKSNNAFALAVASGARGNASHVKSIVSTPGVFQDSKGKVIPMFVRNSYGEGVRPAETLAGTYGGRMAVTSTKKATAKGGDLLKIMTQSALNYNVTTRDCSTGNGIAADPSGGHLTGRVLARSTPNVPAGTVIDRKVLATLRRENSPILVRSAMTCRAEHGLCARCVGAQATGEFHNVGDSVGVTAAQAIGEPIVQNSLNVKHNSGVAKGKKAYSGLSYITQFLSIPDEFKDRAAVAEIAGVVDRIEDAPQGGKFVFVDGTQHFVAPGFEATVKIGQEVEPGEPLSEGLVNPADIVRLRGLGDGRKYYSDRLMQMLRDSGQKPDARNVEIVTRAALDNYVIDDPDEDTPWLPDDMVRESELMAHYTPPKDTADLPVNKATGKFLQAPTLHYTVGTKLTRSMTKRLEDAGISRVPVSSEQPWFKPEMRRLRVASHGSEDWLAAMGTSYLSNQLRSALERGDETDVAENYHYGPRLAFGADAGSGAFGENIERTGKF